MKRLLIYSLVVLAIPTMAVIPVFKMLNAKIVREKKFSALDYCNKSKEYNDIIFLGGSRTRQHIDPRVIDSITHLKTYNLSIDAAGIVECNMLLNKYLEHHPPPHFLFLTIDLSTLDVEYRQPYITDYFDYLNDSIVNRCISPYRLAYRNKAVQDYYKFIRFFSINDREKNNIFFPGKIKEDPRKEVIYSGFKPQSYGWDKRTVNREHYTYQFTSKGVDVLKELIDKCREDSIHVVFLYSPYYLPNKYLVTNYDSIFHKIRNLSGQMNIPFFDYQQLPLCDSIKYFGSAIHLNQKGAEIYSACVARDIKNGISDSTSRLFWPAFVKRKLK